MSRGFTYFRTALRILRKDQILAVVMVFLPVNILIGTHLNEFRAQFPLFRLEETSSGFSVVPITQDLNFVTFWIILWIFGAGILISGIILSFLEKENIRRSYRRTGILIAITGIFFLFSDVLQYNFNFARPEIMIIPIGIPIIVLLCWWIFKNSSDQPLMVIPGE